MQIKINDKSPGDSIPLMILTLTYVVKVMILSDLQQVLEVILSLKSY